MGRYYRHILAFIVYLLVSLASFQAITTSAQSVTFAFDSSPTPGVTNYILYGTTNSFLHPTNSQVKLHLGTNQQVTVYSMTHGNWLVGVSAVANGVEGILSNIVPIKVPEPPTNTVTVFVQYSQELTNGWTDQGYWRVKIGKP